MIYHIWLRYDVWKMPYFRPPPVCVKMKAWHAQENLKHWDVVFFYFHLTLIMMTLIKNCEFWGKSGYLLFSPQSVLEQKLELSKSQLLGSQEPDQNVTKVRNLIMIFENLVMIKMLANFILNFLNPIQYYKGGNKKFQTSLFLWLNGQITKKAEKRKISTDSWPKSTWNSAVMIPLFSCFEFHFLRMCESNVMRSW